MESNDIYLPGYYMKLYKVLLIAQTEIDVANFLSMAINDM